MELLTDTGATLLTQRARSAWEFMSLFLAGQPIADGLGICYGLNACVSPAPKFMWWNPNVTVFGHWAFKVVIKVK